MGWKSQYYGTAGMLITSRNPLSLDMGWKIIRLESSKSLSSRNPLSLDMGWKGYIARSYGFQHRRNPLSLDMGWKHYYH